MLCFSMRIHYKMNSSWVLVFSIVSCLGQFLNFLKRLVPCSTGHKHGRLVGLIQIDEKDLSETLKALTNFSPYTHDVKILSLNGTVSTEPKEFATVLPSLLPSLEILGVDEG